MVGLIKIIIDPEAIMAESTAVRTVCTYYIPDTICTGFNWRAGASRPSRSFERNFLYIYLSSYVV